MLMLQVYKDLYSKYHERGGAKYISIFKNWGEASGASLNHTHSQVVAIPLIPPPDKKGVIGII